MRQFPDISFHYDFDYTLQKFWACVSSLVPSQIITIPAARGTLMRSCVIGHITAPLTLLIPYEFISADTSCPFLSHVDVRQSTSHGDSVRVHVGCAAVRIPPVQNRQNRSRQKIRRSSQQRHPLRRVLDVPGETILQSESRSVIHGNPDNNLFTDAFPREKCSSLRN